MKSGPQVHTKKRDDTMLTYGTNWGFICPVCNLFREGWQTKSEAVDSYAEHQRGHGNGI
jgi:hypothetical protein